MPTSPLSSPQLQLLNMTDHDVFKLKRDILQLRKINEQQKIDIKQKDYRIVELEEEADHLRTEWNVHQNQTKEMEQRLREAEKLINKDDTYQRELMAKENSMLKDQIEMLKRENQEYRTTLDLRDANLNHLRMQLHEVAAKYKDETILRDEFHYRDEVQDNREKMKQLIEKTNQMSQAIERLSAENRVLRKMAGVPDDYQFELDDIIQEGQLQVEKYRAQVRALEEEVEELEEERARLRRIIRGQVSTQEEEENEGSRKALRRENQDLKERNKQLEEEIIHLRQQISEGGFVGGGGGRMAPEVLQQITQQQQEFKEQMTEMIRQMQQGGFQTAQPGGPGVASVIQTRQQVQTTGLAQLVMPPTPIPGAFGNYNDIKEGFSQRFNTKLPVDMTAAYGDSGLDQMQLKYELAALQLQNIETLRLLQVKEKEYADLQNEVQQIKEDLKGKCLLVQDELFLQFVKEREQFRLKYGELEAKYKTQQDVVAEAKIKMIKYQDFLTEVQRGDKDSVTAKLGELTKRTAILDVNLIKLSRKYEALLEEFNQMKASYLICDSQHVAKEKELLEKIYQMVHWKRMAEENMKLMLKQLRESVPQDMYNDLRQKNEYLQDKLCNVEMKEAELLKRVATLEGTERELYEKTERIRALEEEFIEVQLEEEVIKKRLEQLDPYFQKYQQVYNHLVEFIKIKGISPMEIFKQFDINGDGKISRNEFSQAIKNIGIPIMQDEMDVVYMFVDLDGTGQIEYHEFLRRLKRSGVNVRKEEDELLFQLYRTIVHAGLDLRSAFSAFDPDGDNVISKKDMREVLDEMGVTYNPAAIDHIFKMADTSGDNQISYEEFYVLFDDIVKTELMSQGKEIKLSLDWKYQVIIQLDTAVKEQRLTLLDVFNLIDRDGDQVLSHHEFQNMFRDMDTGVQPDDVRQLFDAIDTDHNGQINYNEMLAYLRQGRAEQDKYNKLKFIQERTKELKQQQETDQALQTLSQNVAMTTEARQAMKISILELREKNANQRSQLLLGQLASTELTVKNLNETVLQLQTQMVKSNDTFYKEREENLKLKERLRGALSKEESEKLTRQMDQMKLQVVDLNSALTTYRNLYDTAVMQTKTMKLTIEKIKNDHETLLNTIKDLQSISDQNMTIGKLYHHLMIARWHEAQTNQKNEKILDELRKIKLQVESYDAIVLEKSNEIMQQNQIFTEQIKNYELQITDLKSKILPTVTLQRVEEQAKRLREISEMKSEAEIQNKDLRMKFYELQLKADYFDAYKEKLDNLERKLAIQNPDELSQQIIDTSSKYTDCKIELLRAQRDMQIAKEREEYYQRLNRQYTDTIKRLEFDLSHADIQLRKREEEWRKKFYEQRKTIFAQLGLLDTQEDIKGFSKKKYDASSQLKDIILQKQMLDNKPQKEDEHEDIQGMKNRIADLEAEVKRKSIEIEGYIERQKIVAGGSQIFGQQQMEEYTKQILVQEAEKVSQAGQQMLKAMQEILKDKEGEIQRKEKQIEMLKAESMAHKKKDVEEIQRLSDLVHKYHSQSSQNAQYLGGQSLFVQQQQQDPAQIVMIENYQRSLVEKDKKIKDLEIALETTKRSLNNLKVQLTSELNAKDKLQMELDKERQLNHREQYIQKIETLQKVVNEKNKDLQKVKQTVITLKEELFKISEETISKEQQFKTKEAKLNTNSSELETKLTRMLGDIKSLKQEIKEKQRKVEQLEEKEISHRASITDLEKKNQELRAIIQAGGGKLNEEDQTVTNIQQKLQQYNQVMMENAQLQKELLFLKTQQGGRNMFDKEGNLTAPKGVYFKSFEEFLAVLREYLHTKPRFDILQEFRKMDKQYVLQIPMPKFFEVLSMIGVQLKSRDQRVVADAVKGQNDQADYYYKFYYPYREWADFATEPEDQFKQQAPPPVQQQPSQKFSLKGKK